MPTPQACADGEPPPTAVGEITLLRVAPSSDRSFEHVLPLLASAWGSEAARLVEGFSVVPGLEAELASATAAVAAAMASDQ